MHQRHGRVPIGIPIAGLGTHWAEARQAPCQRLAGAMQPQSATFCLVLSTGDAATSIIVPKHHTSRRDDENGT